MEKDIDKQQEEEKEQQPYRGKTAKKKLPLLLAGLKKRRKNTSGGQEISQDTDGNSDNSDGQDDNKVIEVVPTLSKKLVILITVIVVVVVVFGIISIRHAIANREYKGYEVLQSVETSGDNIADYIQYGNSVLKITKDGTSYIDKNGNTIWDCSYAMKMPKAKVSGDYAVVADMNGRDVYLFDKTGKCSNQTLNYDISNVDVASQGIYVVVLAGVDCNYINAYDKNSNSVYEMKTSIENSGYPLDVSLSEDGKKLFTSYVQISGTAMPNYLAAYNFGSVGKNENADRLMSGFQFDSTVFPLVEFLDNNTVACFGTDRIELYTMSEKASEKAEIDLGDKEMLGVFYNQNYLGYISANSSGKDKYTLYVYNTNGKLESKTPINNSFTKIYATEEEIIIVGDFDCSIYRMNGTKKFQTTFNKSLVNIVPDGNKNEYIVIFENETQTIKLKGSAKDSGDK